VNRCRLLFRVAQRLTVLLVALEAAGLFTSPLAEGRQGGRKSSPTVRDSAGIRIVEYPADAAPGRAIVLESAPWLEIGWRHDATFDRRQRRLEPVELSDGRIAVADYASIKVFDHTGRLVGEGGQEGPGRDQFKHLGKLCRIHGDTLVAFDIGNEHLSLWTPTPSFQYSFVSAGYLTTEPCLEDGSIVVERVPRGASRGSSTTRTMAIVRTHPSGGDIASLTSVPLDEYGLVSREAAIIAARDRVIVAERSRYELRVEDAKGRLVSILRMRRTPQPITADRWRSIVAHGIPSDLAPNVRRSRLEAELKGPHPQTFPAYRDVKVDAGGRLWVQEYERQNLWNVFSADGLTMSRFVMPTELGPGARLASVRSNDVVVSRTDDHGRPGLSFFRIGHSSHPSAKK